MLDTTGGKNQFDVVVVGGGPGGATAGYQLGKHGFEVLLVDKARFPRPKVCGGMITTKTIRLNEEIFNVSLPELKKKNIITSTVKNYELHFRDTQLLEGTSHLPFALLGRSTYDKYLLDRIKAIDNTTVIENKKIRQINPDKNTLTTSSGEKIRAKYIVGADGINSSVRNSLLAEDRLILTEEEWKRNLAAATEAYIPRETVDKRINTPAVHLGILDWGYGWIFPHVEQYVVGVGGLASKNSNFRELLLQYLDLLGLSEGDFVIKGAPMPYGNFLSTPGHGKILLVGDAAGFADPLTAEGIYYAQLSGSLAARAINESENNQLSVLQNYKQKIENQVIPDLKWAKYLRKLFFTGPETLRVTAIKYLLPTVIDTMLKIFHGEKSYNILEEKLPSLQS